MPVLIGVAALGTEGAQVLTLHREAQAAADSAAVSVASYYAAQRTALNTPTSTQLANQAKAVAATYGFVNGANGASVTVNNPPASGNFTSTTWPYAFEVIVSQSHSPLLSSYWLSSAMPVSARAVALINVTTNGSGGGSNANCILALGKSSGGTANLAEAITANGNARLNLQGCSIGTNSSASGTGAANAIYFGSKGSAAINLIESNNILGGQVSAVGGVSISGNGSNTAERCTSVSGTTCNNAATVTPLTGVGAMPNPYAGVTVPSAATCLPLPAANTAAYQCTAGKGKNKTVTPGWCIDLSSVPGNSATLNPGTYCGGIQISGNSNVTLNAGVYVLASTAQNETGLTMANGTTLNGTAGVTLVFTSTDGISYPTASNSTYPDMMDIANGTTVNLTAPTTGTTAGFVIMGDSSMPLGTAGLVNGSPSTGTGSQFVFDNGTTVNLDGAIYIPNGAMSLVGNGAVSMTCSQIIANVIDLTNSGTLNENCTTDSSGGIGSGSVPVSLFGSLPLLVE
jgi:hypothetical protein